MCVCVSVRACISTWERAYVSAGVRGSVPVPVVGCGCGRRCARARARECVSVCVGASVRVRVRVRVCACAAPGGWGEGGGVCARLAGTQPKDTTLSPSVAAHSMRLRLVVAPAYVLLSRLQRLDGSIGSGSLLCCRNRDGLPCCGRRASQVEAARSPYEFVIALVDDWESTPVSWTRPSETVALGSTTGSDARLLSRLPFVLSPDSLETTHSPLQSENRQKFDVEKQTNKLGYKSYKSCGFEQKSCTKVHCSIDKKQTNRANSNLETVDAHAPGHERTNVRREHQAPTHARTSGESTKRTVHIQQWGSHPLSLAGWQGPAKRSAN